MTELDISLYEKIYLIRRAEEKVCEVYPSDVMKTPVHLSFGEESIVAGICQALRSEDQVYGTYRSHALYLAKGGDLDMFFAELYGKATGIAKGKAGSMHISCPEVGFMASSAVVSSIIPVALGAAFAAKYTKSDHIAAVFFGDGATEEGVFWESLNIAGLKDLPILFVCEDNGLAIHTHISDRQCYRIPEAVKSFGINVHSENTTDPEKIFNVAEGAIESIRETSRPCLLHLRYHRYLEHVGINEDYGCGYRCKEDYEHWYAVDPVKVQREKLLSIGIGEGEIRELETAIEKRIHESIRKANEAPYATGQELLEDVYA